MTKIELIALKQNAKNGDAEAQWKLAWLYYEGYEISENYAEAAYWFRRSSDQGYADAQVGLGILYAEGLGVPKNNTIACALYSVAAEYMSIVCIKPRFNDQMMPAEIADAQALASEMAKPGNFTKALDAHLAKGA